MESIAFQAGKAFLLGLAFAKGVRIDSRFAQDASKWITVHPNGKENKGTPVLLDEETGEVLGGMGGKFNGKHISNANKNGAEHNADLIIDFKKNQAKYQEMQRKADEEDKRKAEEAKKKAEEQRAADLKKMQAEAKKATKAKAKKDSSTSSEGEIQDFGEKLEGAKKFLGWKANPSTDDIKTKPLAKTWPIDSVLAIEDTDTAALVFAMRSSLGKKPPSTSYKQKSWVDNAKLLRDAAGAIVNGTCSRDTVDKMKNLLKGNYEILRRIDRSQWCNIDHIGGIRQWCTINSELAAAYGIRPDQCEDGGFSGWPRVHSMTVIINGKKTDFYVGSKQPDADLYKKVVDHINSLNASPSQGGEKKKIKFSIFSNRATGKIFISKDGDKNHTPLHEFNDVKTAIAYRNNNYTDLENAWNALTATNKFTDGHFRNAQSTDRSGKTHRETDASPEMFSQAFGFRGVQFGNWVGQKGALSRQNMLNHAYDALHDMADTLGVNAKSLSLNGKLGLAFGARGSGGINAALAHYEPDQKVINLTKYGGAGSLCHEWFHALDNALGNGENSSYGINEYVGPNYSPKGDKHGVAWQYRDSKSEVVRAYVDLMNAISKSPYYERSRRLDLHKSKPYWSTPVELAARGFEMHVLKKMHEKGEHNDFLVRTDKAEGLNDDSHPWPLEHEMTDLSLAYDKLIDAIKKENKFPS